MKKCFPFIITFTICLFIGLDFLRIAGYYKYYDLMQPIIATLTIFYIFLSIKKIKNSNNVLLYIFVIIFLFLLLFFEIINNKLLNVNKIYEHICWILLPLVWIVNRKYKIEIKIIIMTFIALNLCLAIPTILLHLIDLPVLTVAGAIGKDPGFYGNQNVNGMINAISFCLIIWLGSKEKKPIKIFTILLSTVFLICIFLSGSRSALIAIVLYVLLQLLVKIKNKVVIFSLLLFFGFLCIFVIGFRYKAYDFSNMNFEMIANRLTSFRYELWKEGLFLIKNNLFIGHGMNSMFEMANKYIGESSIIVQRNYNNFHNLFINILYNSGLIAFIVFICGIIDYIAIFVRNKKRDIIGIGIVLCGFIISMLDIPLLYDTSAINIIWWVFVFYTVK